MKRLGNVWPDQVFCLAAERKLWLTHNLRWLFFPSFPLPMFTLGKSIFVRNQLGGIPGLCANKLCLIVLWHVRDNLPMHGDFPKGTDIEGEPYAEECGRCWLCLSCGAPCRDTCVSCRCKRAASNLKPLFFCAVGPGSCAGCVALWCWCMVARIGQQKWFVEMDWWVRALRCARLANWAARPIGVTNRNGRWNKYGQSCCCWGWWFATFLLAPLRRLLALTLARPSQVGMSSVHVVILCVLLRACWGSIRCGTLSRSFPIWVCTGFACLQAACTLRLHSGGVGRLLFDVWISGPNPLQFVHARSGHPFSQARWNRFWPF